MQKRSYNGIDACKLIAAVLIVVLHTIETSNPVAAGVKWVFTHFAVPFFFIASGFFFYHGLDHTQNGKGYFRKYEMRLLKLFLIWAILIYGPITVASYIRNNTGASPLYITLLLIRRIFVIGPGPYWYLSALILTAAFFYVCHLKKWDWLALSAMTAGLILEILYACFRNALSGVPVFSQLMQAVYSVFSWENNFIMYGIPFFGMGYFIAKKDLHIGGRKAAALFAATTFLRMVEYGIPFLFADIPFWQKNCISLAFIPQAIGFFFLAVNWNPSLPEQLHTRQLSTFIYCLHAIVLYDILDPILAYLVPEYAFAPSTIWIKVLVVLAACVGAFRLIRKADNKYLNLLIGG